MEGDTRTVLQQCTHVQSDEQLSGTLPLIHSRNNCSAVQAFNTFLSSFTLVCIAVSRFTLITNKKVTPSVASQRWVLIAGFGVTWTLSIALTVPYYFAVNISEVNLTTPGAADFFHNCSVPVPVTCVEVEDWSEHMPLFTRRSYTLITMILQYFMPSLALFFVYARIGLQVYHRLSNRVITSTRTHRYRLRSSIALLTALVIAFALCWMPFNVYFLLYSVGLIKYSSMIGVFTNFCGALSSILNPILYGLFNRNLRDGFILTLHCFCASIWSVHTSEVVGDDDKQEDSPPMRPRRYTIGAMAFSAPEKRKVLTSYAHSLSRESSHRKEDGARLRVQMCNNDINVRDKHGEPAVLVIASRNRPKKEKARRCSSTGTQCDFRPYSWLPVIDEGRRCVCGDRHREELRRLVYFQAFSDGRIASTTNNNAATPQRLKLTAASIIDARAHDQRVNSYPGRNEQQRMTLETGGYDLLPVQENNSVLSRQ